MRSIQAASMDQIQSLQLQEMPRIQRAAAVDQKSDPLTPECVFAAPVPASILFHQTNWKQMQTATEIV